MAHKFFCDFCGEECDDFTNEPWVVRNVTSRIRKIPLQFQIKELYFWTSKNGIVFELTDVCKKCFAEAILNADKECITFSKK